MRICFFFLGGMFFFCYVRWRKVKASGRCAPSRSESPPLRLSTELLFFIIPSLIILRTPSLLLFFLLFFFEGGTRKHWTWKSSWGVGEAVTGNRATCQPKSRASTWSSVSSFQTIIITNFRVIMMSRPESTKPQKRERNKRCEKSKAKDYVVRTNNIAKAATIPGIPVTETQLDADSVSVCRLISIWVVCSPIWKKGEQNCLICGWIPGQQQQKKRQKNNWNEL